MGLAVDQVVFDLFPTMKAKNVYTSRTMVQQKTLETANENKSFKASSGCLTKFKAKISKKTV